MDTRLNVLALKLKGKSPEQISQTLGIRLAEVYKHDKAIKQQMLREKESDIVAMSPEAIEAAAETVNSLMPYMTTAMNKLQKQSESLKPLFGDIVENAEMVQVLISRQLAIELSKDEPDLTVVERLTELITKCHKAFFNKDGIQVVNVLNDSVAASDAIKEKESKEERLLKLKANFDAIDVEV